MLSYPVRSHGLANFVFNYINKQNGFVWWQCSKLKFGSRILLIWAELPLFLNENIHSFLSLSS